MWPFMPMTRTDTLGRAAARTCLEGGGVSNRLAVLALRYGRRTPMLAAPMRRPLDVLLTLDEWLAEARLADYARGGVAGGIAMIYLIVIVSIVVIAFLIFLLTSWPWWPGEGTTNRRT